MEESGVKRGDYNLRYAGFLQLPAEIKVHIVEYLRDNRKLLLVLCLVNKLFNELAVPIIYANVNLNYQGYHGPWDKIRKDDKGRLFIRQRAYLGAIGHHTTYLAMARHLKWDYTGSGGAVFPQMTNLQSIDINTRCISVEAINPIFPNLRKARLGGVFPPGTMESIALSSSLLTELHLVDAPGECSNREVGSIIPFLDLCVSTPERLSHLKLFHISRPLREDRRTELAEPSLKSWARFLLQFSHQLENLSLQLWSWNEEVDHCTDVAFQTHIIPVLTSGKFESLRRLEVVGYEFSAEHKIHIIQALPSEWRCRSTSWRFLADNMESLEPCPIDRPGPCNEYQCW